MSHRNVRFVWCKFFLRTPQICESSSLVYIVLDPSSFALNHCGYSHTEVCSDPVQHLTGNSSDLRLNQHMNSLGIVSADPVF